MRSIPSAGRIGPPRLGSQMRRRLAAFTRTLRDHGFRFGLAETRDALLVLTSPMAARPGSLETAFRALFCATHSDWERFGAIFEGFWRGRLRWRAALEHPLVGASTRLDRSDAGAPAPGPGDSLARALTAKAAAASVRGRRGGRRAPRRWQRSICGTSSIRRI
jgi:uncharacterized protein